MTNFTHKTNDGNSIAWRDKATYGASIIRNYLDPLEKGARESGRAPVDLQRSILLSLQWYFATDIRERAPTVIVNEPMAIEFHELVRRVMEHIDVDVIASLEQERVDPEVMHALLSYKGFNCHSPIVLDAYDHDQGLVRLTYYLHGTKPSEVFRLDGKPVEPAYAKYRGCRFFRRMLMRQRIVWLPASKGTDIALLLDGKPVVASLQQHKLLASDMPSPGSGEGLLPLARAAYPPGKGLRQAPFSFAGLKAFIFRWIARNPFIRRKYSGAWVFIDRTCDANDNAEHFYRWVRRNHPEINAWFLLTPTSHDWERLAREGFRLMPQGLQRKLLLLNSENIISSHPEFIYGGFNPGLYGGLMRWRYTFLRHGTNQADQSHWLGKKPFDLIVTTTPAEHASMVDDDTPYSFTTREIRRAGMPRYDRLLRYAAELSPDEVDVILVMPTWRGGLVDERAAADTEENRLAAFASSEYAMRWRALLGSEELRELSERYAKKIVFLPHPNSVPYLAAFEPPAHVLVAMLANISIQHLLSKSIAFVTDFTSVAFDMALLRRPVFYYHFDREGFYGGDHNWREGYFNYERDGFGPVAFAQDELIGKIRVFLENGAKPAPEYLARMEKAMPERDGQSCKRVYESILAIRKPFVAPSPTPKLFNWP